MRINLVNSSPGKFLITEHAILAALFNQSQLVEVLHLRPSRSWVLQNLSLPIIVTPSARVLLRMPGMPDKECIGFQHELSLVSGKRSRSLSFDAAEILPSMTTPNKRTRGHRETKVATVVLDNVAVGADSTAIYDIPACEGAALFPKTYTCDMVDGMQALDGFKLDSDISAAFACQFPGTVYVRKTFLKHRLVYRKAAKSGLLPEFIQRGATFEGKWSRLVTRVNALDKAARTTGM